MDLKEFAKESVSHQWLRRMALNGMKTRNPAKSIVQAEHQSARILNRADQKYEMTANDMIDKAIAKAHENLKRKKGK